MLPAMALPIRFLADVQLDQSIDIALENVFRTTSARYDGFSHHALAPSVDPVDGSWFLVRAEVT